MDDNICSNDPDDHRCDDDDGDDADVDADDDDDKIKIKDALAMMTIMRHCR